MATYSELYTLLVDITLQQRVTVAVLVACDAIRTEGGGVANHAERVVWAREALVDPAAKMRQILPLLLAMNRAMSLSSIQAVADADLQTAVNGVVNLFAVV